MCHYGTKDDIQNQNESEKVRERLIALESARGTRNVEDRIFNQNI
jgi:hypothetical protein